MSDEQLILQFKQGNREAFTELFERYRQPVYGFFRRRLNDRGRAEELAQETFLAVIRGATRYEPRALFRTYLYSIALNLLRAERRRLSRSVHESLDADNGERQGAAAQIENSAFDEGIWVRDAIGHLDESHREVLMLREYEQLSYAEIAELLRVPLNTVRSQLFRARMALKEFLCAAAPPVKGAV